MAAELEINPTGLRLLKMIRLVVQKQGEAAVDAGGSLQDLCQALPSGIGPVVPAYDGYAAVNGRGVPQQPDAGILVELLGPGLGTVILVVAQGRRTLMSMMSPPNRTRSGSSTFIRSIHLASSGRRL